MVVKPLVTSIVIYVCNIFFLSDVMKEIVCNKSDIYWILICIYFTDPIISFVVTFFSIFAIWYVYIK